jgi:DNA-directed RNA polymerase subunit omega
MAQGRNTLMDPPIEDLLDKVDSKFTLVALGAARARQVNSYYNSLGEGLGKVVPPQVASVSGKPVSIAFEEIAAGKATYTRIDPEAEAEAALALAEAEAEVELDVEDIIEDAVLSEVLSDVAAEDEADDEAVDEAEIELLDVGDGDPTAS